MPTLRSSSFFAVFVGILFAFSTARALAIQCPFAGQEGEPSYSGAIGDGDASYPAGFDSSGNVRPPMPGELAAVHGVAKVASYNDMTKEWGLNEGAACSSSGGTPVLPNPITTLMPGGETNYTPDFPGFPGQSSTYLLFQNGTYIIYGAGLGCSVKLVWDVTTPVWEIHCQVRAMGPFLCCKNMQEEGGGEGGEGGGGAGEHP